MGRHTKMTGALALAAGLATPAAVVALDASPAAAAECEVHGPQGTARYGPPNTVAAQYGTDTSCVGLVNKVCLQFRIWFQEPEAVWENVNESCFKTSGNEHFEVPCISGIREYRTYVTGPNGFKQASDPIVLFRGGVPTGPGELPELCITESDYPHGQGVYYRYS